MNIRYLFGNIIILGMAILTEDVLAGLTLEQLWQITDNNNLSLMQQEKMISRAREEIAIQQTNYYPSVSTSAYGAWMFFNKTPSIFQGDQKDVTLNVFSLNVNQTIFTGFRIKNSVAYAEENFHAQSLEKEISRNSLFFEVGQLYYNIQSNLLQEQVLTESINRIENQLIKIKNLLSAQQATAFDTLELANKKLQIQTQLSSLKGQTDIIESQLRYMINEPNLTGLDKSGEFTADITLGDISDYFQLAIEKRPEMRQVAARKRGQSHFTNALEAAYYPMISASGAYNKARLDGFIFDGSWFDFYSVFLTLQWELWSWKKDKRKVQQSKLEIERIEIASQDLILSIEQQVRTAYRMLEITRDQMLLQQRLVEQETERFRQTRERYQQGLTSVLDLNSAENDLTSAQLELQKSKILWHKNKLQLDYATGNIGNIGNKVTKKTK